jgi:hypothetical protein
MRTGRWVSSIRQSIGKWWKGQGNQVKVKVAKTSALGFSFYLSR